MKRLFRWGLKLALLSSLPVAGLLLPVAYVEFSCTRKPAGPGYAALLPSENSRPESRTLMTYPEWHIVHAYDDYARVLSRGDPHDFRFFQAVRGFWSSLCQLSDASADHGGVTDETKQMVYTIGVSFTAEMLLKAAYEETLGFLATLIRGEERAPLDLLSAKQAAAYAQFLQQTPWYRWDFALDAKELDDVSSSGFRDVERQLALGLEYRAKALYAGAIAKAVANMGPDDLRLRMIARGATAADMEAYQGVTVIGPAGDGIEIETPRYRELTHLLRRMAWDGVNFVEIAGNDDILLTATAPGGRIKRALYSFPRQGYGDYRHLILVKVTDLAQVLRDMRTGPLALEHIHDY